MLAKANTNKLLVIFSIIIILFIITNFVFLITVKYDIIKKSDDISYDTSILLYELDSKINKQNKNITKIINELQK